MKRSLSLLAVVATLVAIVPNDSYAHRYFDSWSARWTTPDPALHNTDPRQVIKKYGYDLFEVSPYSYSNDNPIRRIDPDGKQGIDAIGGPILLSTSWKELEYRVIGTAVVGAAMAAAYYAPGLVTKAVQLVLANPAATAAISTAAAESLAPPGAGPSPAGAASEASQIVLGKFPDYIKVGDETGSKVFNMASEVWNKMSADERWGANVKFLDEAISRGDKIKLSNPVSDITQATGTFKKELEYLAKKGYKLNRQGNEMIK